VTVRLRLFVRAYRLSQWADRRFTLAGKAVVIMAVASGVFGLDTGRTAGYQVFALAAALLVVSSLSIFRWRPRLQVRRSLPELATVGVPMHYQIVVSFTRPISGAVVIRDELVERFPSSAEFARERAVEEPAANAVDRRIGFPRWRLLAQRLRGGRIAPVTAMAVAGAAELRVDPQFIPLRRGRVRFARTRVLRPDVLGLIHGAVSHPSSQSLLVLPRTYDVPDLRFPGSRRHHRGGDASVAEVGDSQEFLQVREYRPGDPLRRIHWGRSARTGRLVVKEMGEEYFARYGLVLDTFAAPADSLAFETAVSVAASLARRVRTADALLDLVFVEDRAIVAPAGRGSGGRLTLLRELAEVVPARKEGFDVLARAVLAHAPQLSACVHVCLRFDEERADLVRKLSRLGVAQLVLTMRAPEVATGAVPVHVIDPAAPGPTLATMPDFLR